MDLKQWAARWAIPDAAIDELCKSSVFHPDEEVESDKPRSEARVQSEVRLEAAREGIYLFRNNVGAGRVEGGGFMRWGLGNDSKKFNEVLKSADLVGVRRVLITAEMVGRHIGQFVSRETKKRDWKWTGSADEHAQLRWATLINAQGGDAKIVNGVGSFKT